MQLEYTIKNQLEKILHMSDGHVKGFDTVREFEQFFKSYGFDVTTEEYRENNTLVSKARRMRKFWELESSQNISMIILKLSALEFSQKDQKQLQKIANELNPQAPNKPKVINDISKESTPPNKNSFYYISEEMKKFQKDYKNVKTAFIIMDFTKSNNHDLILNTIISTCNKFNITALRADNKEYCDDLLHNIEVYMHGCTFAISVFDNLKDDNIINSNVSFETGYVKALGKKVLLLKDKNITKLQTDLAGKLYKEFDTNNIADSLEKVIKKWIEDNIN